MFIYDPDTKQYEIIFDKQEKKYLRNRKCLKLAGDVI